MEVWKKIVLFGKKETYCSVSNTGFIRNDVTGKFIELTQHSSGYVVCDIGGYAKDISVMLLVAIAFVERPEHVKGAMWGARHIDKDHWNNDASNIEWYNTKAKDEGITIIPDATPPQTTKSRSKSFKLCDDKGNVFEGSNVKKFCTDHNLSYSSTLSLIAGKITVSKDGWTVQE